MSESNSSEPLSIPADWASSIPLARENFPELVKAAATETARFRTQLEQKGREQQNPLLGLSGDEESILQYYLADTLLRSRGL